MKILNSKITSIIVSKLIESVRELIKDPDFTVKVSRIKELTYISTFNSEPIIQLILTIETNNSPLFLGQFVHFNNRSMRGFHVDYLTAKIECLLQEEIDNANVKFEIYFDVKPIKNKLTFNYVYRPVDFDTSLSLGLLTPNSKLAKAMRKYNLTTIMLAGGEVSGPIFGVIKAIEQVCMNHKVIRCLDLFSGTGSLAKVALDNNVQYVDCVDINANIIPSTLKGYENRYKIHNVNAFNFIPSQKYDLVILDPFYDLSLEVAEELLPKYIKIASLVVFNLGLRMHNYWITQIKKRLEAISSITCYKQIGENVIGFIEFN